MDELKKLVENLEKENDEKKQKKYYKISVSCY